MKYGLAVLGAVTATAFAAESATASDDAGAKAREKRIERVRLERAQTAQKQLRPKSSRAAPSSLASLGAKLYSDRSLSLNRNQACESCHALSLAKDLESGRPLPAIGFVDNDNVTNGTAVSDGSDVAKFGSLNSPSAGYAAFSPAFHWDAVEGLYVGGQFWNGRSNDLAEQAQQPFLNPVEMAMPSRWAVVSRLKENPNYVYMFRALFDIDLGEVPSNDRATASEHAPGTVLAAYDAMSKAIAAFEQERRFNRFTSKFDFVLAGKTSFTGLESRGEELFNGKAQCNACHVSDPGIAPDGTVMPPLFTDFTYDNIGVPRNLKIPGTPSPDPGLGGRADVAARDPAGAEIGKHKVMPLRNIAITPPYAHNGVFETLLDITHFYNTRDTLGRVDSNLSAGFGVRGWPAPEIPQNVNVDELGDLGLTPAEERAIVAFMKTLTDGYPDWGRDPKVPPGTPSPYANMPFPPFAR